MARIRCPHNLECAGETLLQMTWHLFKRTGSQLLKASSVQGAQPSPIIPGITPSMAMDSLSIPVAATCVFLLIVGYLWNLRTDQKEAAIRGCGRSAVVPHNDPLGFFRFWQLLQARREHKVLPWMVDVMDSAGPDVHTAKDTILGHNIIWTRDLENSKAVLMNSANDFEIIMARQQSPLPVIGAGILTKTQKAWRESRAFFRPHVTRDQASKLDLVEKHFRVLLNRVPLGEDGWTLDFDIQPLVYNLTLDFITEILFGSSANSQLASGSKSSAYDLFNYHWDRAQEYLGIRAALGRFCWMYSPRKFREHCRAIHDFTDAFVLAALERKQSHGIVGHETTTKVAIVDELVKVTSDRVQLRSECLNLLGAGRTGTAALISWILYFLARHPSVFNKLRQIVLVDFGSSDEQGEITLESLKRCQYLHDCINETFRMSPVIPLIARVAIRNTTLPTGGGPEGKDPIFVAKGTEIQQAFYPICMRKDLWGEDGTTFRPERFENRKLGSEWLPFGSGPRICVGRRCLGFPEMFSELLTLLR